MWALSRGTVDLRPLETVQPAALESLREEAADVLRYLGLPDRPATVGA